MVKARISYLLDSTVHRETVMGYQISITTEPDGRAVVVVYDEADRRVQVLMYRTFERCEVLYDESKVVPVQADLEVGPDPSVRAAVSAFTGPR